MDIQQQLKDATRLMHDGNLEQAELQYQKVLEIDPNQAFASFCLGYIHQRQSNFADAIAFYEKAIYSKPNYIEALHNLGNTYKEQQNPAKAIEAYQRVIQLKPDSPDTYVNLGAAWRLAGNTAEAIAAYQRAIQLDSSLGQAYSNLGNALDDQGRLSEAIAAYERALQLNPNSAQTCGNLANTLKDQGRLDEAIMAYERALQLNPDNITGHSNRLLALNYGRDNPSNIYVKHRKWAERQTAGLRTIKLHHNRDQNRQLRIGYVSGDLKEHSVANFLEALLITRDRTAFAITCYANNIQVDAVTQRLQQLSDRWRDIYALNDTQIVELIRQDEIDILVDLSGHTKGNRLLVFAHKPAPVQISYIGYPNTTGLDTVDYRFTDGWADPEGQTEPLHTEQLVRLPHGFLCYQPRLDCPEVGALPVLAAIVGADEAIAGKPITFGSFNALPKVNSELVSCWSAMLAAVPQSRLMLKAKGLADAATCEYVTGLFKAQGIGRDRLQLLGQTASQQDHLALYNQIDIALDTFPYNGTATTCEALWMGVPVITLAGRTHVGRVGVSLLSSIGLPELIADSTEAYIQKAVELAHDVERLQVLRASLRDRMRAAPLMNAELITQSVESAYRRLWHNYVHHQTAKMHRRQGRLKEAAQTYQTILANQANDVVAHFALGSIYQEQKYVAEAIAAYQRAVDLKPDLAEAHINLGMALRSNHQLAEAIAAYKRGLQLKPDCAEAYNNLGNALKESGKFGEATAAYQQALQIRPNYPVAHSNFLFSLNYDSSYAPLAVYQEHRQWAARQAAAFTQSVRPHANNTDLNRRLRIGYVSNDFKTHSVAYFLEPLLAAHNHQRFEVIGYSNNDFEDATTQRLKQQVHRWQNIASLSPEQAADCIRQDQVDILVDLSGHTKRHRLLVFAGKPAPVQVTYLGYPNTTGLDAIDYRLTDTWADPVGQTEHWHVEHLVHLPHGFLCYQPPSNCPAVGPLPALASMSAAAATIATRPITFGSFNNLAKVSPSVVAHWAAILRAVPQARMVIKARALGASGTCGYLFDLFEQQGIERDRLDLIAWMPAKQDHLALYNQIDIALDTFPYSGTTTTCEALWMGVPVITLAGQTHVSRVGVSILASAGLPELIADSAQAYIQKAVDLANDLEQLQVLRASLRDRLQASPLTNADLITQSIEQAYRAMWQSWCEEQHEDGNQPSLKSQLKAAKKAFDSDDLAQAKSQYQAILAQELEHTKAHFYLGVIAQKQGHAAEAIAAYQQVVDLQPDFVAALWNLGNLHKEQEQYDAAIECYRQLIELKPQESDYYADLGSALRSKGQNAEAIAAYDEALQLDPNFAKAHCNRGNVLLGQCKVAEAIAGYRRALAIRPDYTSASNNLLMTLNYSPDEDPVAVYEEHRRWAATQAAAIASPIIHHPQRRAGDRRLRIGYVSGDLKTHSVSDFLQPLLANRDATKFETICYANNRRTDGQTKRLRKLADGWRDISMLSDAAVTDLIRQDQVDILVDLSGHTKDNRLLVFAQKPAPVQITYIGYPNTTGLSAMDYRFTDAWADPEGQTEHLYTEQLVRLPHGFLCYRPVRDCPAVNPLPALATGRITFGSFNSLFKVTPQLIAHWAAIMTAVPDSQLILKARPLADPDTRSHIHHLFDQQGITSDRVQLRDRIKKRKNHIALYHQIDIALDTFPYNGTTTTCEALWMGVPVITLAGRVHAARMGLSLLSAVELTELIADSTEDYVQRAIALANDLARLQTLRASLRDRLQNAPLTNAKLITQSLEDAYRTMWQDFSDKHTLESDQRLVEIKGGVQVCVQDDISKLTTYVLMEQGDWFEAEMDFVRQLITPGMEVLDIGANHGVYTLTMAHALQGQGRITAYEPDESVVRHLRQSIHANAFETVEVVVAGLSGQAGEATFFLSTNSEMNSLQQSSAKQKQVTIQLLTLDEELDQRGWQDITFVKLDAEGEEGKILDGGQRFFAEQSPLVMFELKHGQQVNLPLIDRFKQLGCDIYRLVPGLGCLVPFDVNQPVDGYQLNLFACKGDRAQQLAERGLLVQAIEAPPALPAPHYWLDAMAQFAYAQSILSQFEILRENTNQDRQQYLDGLSYFFLAQDENRAVTEQAAALQIAFEQLHRAAQRKSSFARQCSLARVAAAWGQRSISVQALKGLAKTQTSHQSVQINEPFLPVSDRYDALAFSDHLPDWLFVSIIETYERSYCFSSYYATQRSVSLLDQVVSKPFHSGQAERRFSLAQKRLKGDRQWMEPASSNVSLDPDQRLIETQDGIQVCVKNDVSSMTTYVLLEQGDWFEAEMDFVRRLITPGMQVLDVGANHGVYTLLIAKLLQGQGQVFAYEPDDLVLRHLRQSIAANALDTIEIIAAGLSGHEGEATFFLSPNSELNSLHKTKDTETKVTIQLLTLDKELERHGWQNIEFIKLDAEGEEVNILAGGQRFFEEQSPLVMFELISHKMNRPLVKRFQEIGYDIYRYVPGPGFLAPFSLNNPIDGFQLNLFACKRDRAQQLAARRLLVQDASIELPPPPPSYWFEAIAQLSYVQPLLNQFAQLKDRAQNNPNKQAYLEGISYFFASQQAELSAPEQLAALQSAFDRLQQAVNTSPSFARHCTFARVAAELGQRKLSVQSLGQLVNALLANKPIQIDEPFLPVSSRYDNVAFNDNFQDWIFVTIVETYERSYTFSSYYSAPKSIGLLNRIVQRPFHSPQVERRLAAAKQRLATLPSPKQSSNQQKEVKKQPIPKKTEPKFILIKAWGYGFWSDIDHVLGQLLVAELSGRIPIIHWGDNCLYRDEANSSAFETFFEPISTYTIDDLLGQSYTFYPHKWTEANLETNNLNKWKGSGSKIGGSVFLSRQEDVVVSDFHTYTYHLQKHIPANHPLAGKSLQGLYRYLFHKYLKLKPEISHDIEQFWSENLAGHPTLAVHVRGSDKVKEFPELDAINQKYDLAIAAHLESHPNTLIFLLTDEVSVLTDYQQKYGDRLCYADAFRGNQAKGIHYQAHASHKQLGFEVIKDTYLAAKCDYFIGNGRSVVSATVLHLKEWSGANHILLAENILLNRPTPMPKTVDGLLKSARDLGEQGKTQEAIKHYRKALSLDPNCFAAAVNLGNMLKKDGQYGAALDSYRKGIAILPNNPAAENNLANVLKDQGLTNEAIRRFRRAFSLDASFIHAHSNLLLTLNYSSDYVPTDVLAEHQNWAKVYAAPLAKNIRAHSNTPNPDRKLRVGYVSTDFKAHPVAYFLEPILASFDRSAFEVICYSNSNSTDVVTERLQNLASKWRNISALTNQQAADLVSEDQIDILVDLGGHTSGNRLLVFAHKPAPVQVTYIGYPNTTGLDTIDYRITDAWADPEGQTEPFHTEELVRLPHGFLCYQPQPETPDIEPASALAVGQITFGSFNNLAKVSPQLIGSWSAILAAVPQAKLILKSTPFSDAATRDSIAKLFEQNGIDRDRLELFGRLPTLNEHLSLYNRVDIALDTFPYNGTTTTCDALWMGTPVIALAGQTHVSRVGVSLLSAVGLTELIAESTEDYIQKAIALANDSERLQTLQGELRERMQRSPLLNAELFTRSLEDAYQIMWRRWCEACQSKA